MVGRRVLAPVMGVRALLPQPSSRVWPAPSSRGPGHGPLKAETRVQIPLGPPKSSALDRRRRGGAMITPMPWRRALILMFLAVWAFTGPIGMAFDGCALSCDEPCALATASISAPPTVPFIASVAGTA